jgi:hypothetical protein
MGGRGSGWQSSSAPMVERAGKIDLADLKQHSADFAQGEGVALGSALVNLKFSGLRLRYMCNKQYLDELVPFTFTDTQFGGRRRWLSCLDCGGRCRVIYGDRSRRYRCRKCHGLVYRSKRQPWDERSDTQADKLALKICGGDRELYDGEEFPEKPKRMRWETYHRLEERYCALKDQWAAGLMLRLGIGVT